MVDDNVLSEKPVTNIAYPVLKVKPKQKVSISAVLWPKSYEFDD
jgi:hypothetical protein